MLFQRLHQPVHLRQDICFFVLRLLCIVQIRLLVDGRLFCRDRVLVLDVLYCTPQVDNDYHIPLQTGCKSGRVGSRCKAVLVQHMAFCRLYHCFIAADRSRPQHVTRGYSAAAINQWDALVSRGGNSLARFEHGVHHFLRSFDVQITLSGCTVAQKLIAVCQHVGEKILIAQHIGCGKCKAGLQFVLLYKFQNSVVRVRFLGQAHKNKAHTGGLILRILNDICRSAVCKVLHCQLYRVTACLNGAVHIGHGVRQVSPVLVIQQPDHRRCNAQPKNDAQQHKAADPLALCYILHHVIPSSSNCCTGHSPFTSSSTLFFSPSGRNSFARPASPISWNC